MAKSDPHHLDEQTRTLLRSAAFILVVFAVGVLGYLYIGGAGTSVIDATYMTVITLTTVGYGETIDLSDKPIGRVFTMGVLLIGAGGFVYFFSTLTAFVLEGNFDRLVWTTKMRRAIRELDQHYIICGGGKTGRHMIREMIQTERRFVVLDVDEPRVRALRDELETDFPIVIGDATDEDVLREAGIERASGLCTALASDRDNLLITMTARMLRPELRIVARCSDEKMQQKLRRAGANAIVLPETIGGMRLVSELIRPDAVTFLDTMLRDKDKRLRVEVLALTPKSRAVNQTLGELRAVRLRDLLIVALRDGEGDAWQFNPPDGTKLRPGASVVFMASPEARKRAEELWG